MKYKKLFVFPLFIIAALSLCSVASAQASPPTYQLVTTITLPGGLAGFDIAWIDPGTQRFYLADRTATKGTGRIDVIDTQKNTFLYAITGFVGNAGSNISGPNGVVAIPYLNQLYVGDGDSNVKVVDLSAKSIVATISTGGSFRADELAYDPLDHIIMIANPNDSPPFLTFISADTQAVLGHYTYSNSQSTSNGGGLEQSVWNPLTKRFYLSVPATNTSLGGIDVINPLTMLVENHISTPCSPTGLVLSAGQHLMTACGLVVDVASGNLLTQIPAATADELWYNAGDNRYYFGSTNAAVVDAGTNQFVTFLPSAGGHTLAVDPNNNRIFAPVTGVGIKVFAQH